MDKGRRLVMKTIITFIIVFGILVLVHEFGHFFFAKRSGILVREFAIGMDQRFLLIKEKMEQHIQFGFYQSAGMYGWLVWGKMKQN